MKIKYLITVLIALVVVLILIFSFSVYESLKGKEIKEPQEKEYMAEEIVEEEIIPEETAEIPTMEEIEKELLAENDVTITIKNLRFSPEKIIISPGTTVTWINNDTSPHKVVAYDRLFYGPRLNLGDKYSFTFTKEGMHRYFDASFPKIGRGTIIVQEEPLPITGGVIGVDLGREETNSKFALLILLFAVMIGALSHAIYKHHRV